MRGEVPAGWVLGPRGCGSALLEASVRAAEKGGAAQKSGLGQSKAGYEVSQTLFQTGVLRDGRHPFIRWKNQSARESTRTGACEYARPTGPGAPPFPRSRNMPLFRAC